MPLIRKFGLVPAYVARSTLQSGKSFRGDFSAGADQTPSPPRSAKGSFLAACLRWRQGERPRNANRQGSPRFLLPPLLVAERRQRARVAGGCYHDFPPDLIQRRVERIADLELFKAIGDHENIRLDHHVVVFPWQGACLFLETFRFFDESPSFRARITVQADGCGNSPERVSFCHRPETNDVSPVLVFLFPRGPGSRVDLDGVMALEGS